MQHHKEHWSRAFTLIEIVITIAISTILILAITQLYALYGRTIASQEATIGVTLGASGIMEAVRAAGLQADHIVASHTFSGVTHSSSATTVIFELPAIDVSGAIIEGVYDYVGISASDTRVYRFIDAGPGSVRFSGTKILTSVLDAINFTYDNADLASAMSFTADATTTALVKGQTFKTHLREHIYLRNL